MWTSTKKDHATYKGNKIRLLPDFYQQHFIPEENRIISLRLFNGEKHKPRVSYSLKRTEKNTRHRWTVVNKQELTEYYSNEPVLKDLFTRE